jgi:hypothetical protein
VTVFIDDRFGDQSRSGDTVLTFLRLARVIPNAKVNNLKMKVFAQSWKLGENLSFP